MGKRGPKSSAELAIPSTVDESLPVPPEGLSEDEIDLFMDIAQRLPASYFPPETWEQLAGYCRHANSFRDLSKMVNKARSPNYLEQDGGFEMFETLLKMREREGRAMMALARALRLTNQSRYNAKTAARQSGRPGRSAYDMLGDF